MSIRLIVFCTYFFCTFVLHGKCDGIEKRIVGRIGELTFYLVIYYDQSLNERRYMLIDHDDLSNAIPLNGANIVREEDGRLRIMTTDSIYHFTPALCDCAFDHEQENISL